MPEKTRGLSNILQVTQNTGENALSQGGPAPEVSPSASEVPGKSTGEGKPGKPRLSDKVKRFILECNAQFEAPSAVVERVRESFGLQVTPQQVEYYNPTKTAGRLLKPLYQDHFWAARQEYLESIRSVGVAHQARRLECLDRLLARAIARQNIPLILKILKQAAQESGLMFVYSRWLQLAERDSLVREFRGLTEAQADAHRRFKRWAQQTQQV